jgi:hypothetical protein
LILSICLLVVMMTPEMVLIAADWGEVGLFEIEERGGLK